MIWNGVDGIVIGNTINNCGTTMTAGSGFGIQEVHPASNRNLIIGNQLTNNFGGPVRFDGPDTEVARNLGGISVNTSDSGGFRQTVDVWNQNGGLTGTAIEVQRFGLNPVSGGAGRFRAVRPGSVTGIVITSDTAWTAGTLTVEVYINNSGTAGGAIIGTGLTTLLDSAHTKRNSNTQAKDISKFLPGDELTIEDTAASWAPTNANIRCALEIED